MVRFFRKRRANSPEELLRPHFDERYYLSLDPQLEASGEDPVRHYLRQGAREGRDPTPWFSTFGYLSDYPDVLLSGINPFIHYLSDGRREGRRLSWIENGRKFPPPAYQPDGDLDPVSQILRYLHWLYGDGDLDLPIEDIRASGRGIVSEHLKTGKVLLPSDDMALQLHIAAVRDEFDASHFLHYDQPLSSQVGDSLTFYCNNGWRQFSNPREKFDVWWYWRCHLNRSVPVLDPLLHYALIGKHSGLSTCDPRGGSSIFSITEMAERDLLEPKHDSMWVFPVCAYDHNLSGNDRAVFEAVRHDPSIRKIILTRSRNVELDGANVEVYPIVSREGQLALLRSRVIFIKHSPAVNLEFPVSGDRHLFVCLWHGVPFKRIGVASLDTRGRREEMRAEHARLTAVIASSHIDRLAMAASFQPLAFEDIWLTGLPRHDLITRNLDALPPDLRCEFRALQNMLAGKRLILFVPTFRNEGVFEFGSSEVESIRAWLYKNNAVLGVREHMADENGAYIKQLVGREFLSLSNEKFPNIEVLYRASDCLITDYSSCFIDYMLTGKASISFAYDLDRYRSSERGTFHDLATIFPGAVCETFGELMTALQVAADDGFVNCDPQLEAKRAMFLGFADGRSSERVVERVRSALIKANENLESV